ncbi:SubName: Full=Related to MRP7-mitochondrial ribosomal protein, large subunit {ECO:0000313/EMBL:CCA69666.1} [Serendipita indica DSM 11827]|uniref:Large ribosomal subunit protein bL27m n=1 Tax=Serendipita indica (strain DSM 11827) TaxID=1109443 RepID=G4TEB9_SERID|nr:SubName: Full=Related to MRP7-mitochondrial ribosomal protein, large subunit {ECO:0000313/EMBL:CCA69666.1} [Serendipita indica DSM 11827]CCA69666.1 related to MRP7-mitochondrial ribosomal protein, large subunit [Serendipita indica DSM 11827]
MITSCTSALTRIRCSTPAPPAWQCLSRQLNIPWALPNALGQIRTATKRAGGSIKNHGGSAGRRLGIKKFSDEFVTPGSIIVRQRGTKFHPGQHVLMGRDHTLYAAVPGYVRFYIQTSGRFSRKYVGLVLDRGERLPRDEAEHGRSRYFGLVELNGVETA